MQIELQRVSKQLGGSLVLDQIDLTLEGGQIVVVLGANGAGKTTLLHLLGTLYQPTSGELLLDGEPLQRERLDQRSRMHYLPDLPSMSPSQTALDYLVYALEAYGLSGEASDQRVVELLTKYDLLPVADSPSRSLSRGQRYKVALVALIAIDPEIWILDEPFTSGMDPLGLTAMRGHLFEAKSRGRLIIYSTQLVEIAQQTSDRVCVLADSQIAAFGSADELRVSADHSPELNALLTQLSDVAR